MYMFNVQYRVNIYWGQIPCVYLAIKTDYKPSLTRHVEHSTMHLKQILADTSHGALQVPCTEIVQVCVSSGHRLSAVLYDGNLQF